MPAAAPAKAPDGDIARRLLAWYDRHRRRLPWRAPPGARADPYRVWLSEIMLQQTTVAAVGPYFESFVARWPGVEDLARATLDQVLHAWQGLGYYARARNLHACARAVVRRYGGRFPDTVDALRALPGIGPYTAAAVAAIAFDHRAMPVDANVERVTARLCAVTARLPAAKTELRRLAEALTPQRRAGDFAQAMMDLGAAICTPRRPRCPQCPLAALCRARKRGIAERLPARAARKKRPLRRGVAFWIERPDGAVLLRRRPPSGLLGGLMEVPSSEWRERPWRDGEAGRAAPMRLRYRRLPGVVRHGFTHFELELSVLCARARAGAKPPRDARFCALDRLSDHALPTLMRKVIAHALKTRAQ